MHIQILPIFLTFLYNNNRFPSISLNQHSIQHHYITLRWKFSLFRTKTRILSSWNDDKEAMGFHGVVHQFRNRIINDAFNLMPLRSAIDASNLFVHVGDLWSSLKRRVSNCIWHLLVREKFKEIKVIDLRKLSAVEIVESKVSKGFFLSIVLFVLCKLYWEVRWVSKNVFRKIF